MSDDRFPANEFRAEAGDATRGAATWSDKFEQAARSAGTRRTVGVYERPARRAKLSLPLLTIVILATLISLILSIRFLF